MTDADGAAPSLKRALGLRDLVFFYIACIVSLSSVAQVAQFGFASLTLYALAIVTFLIPSGLVVAELHAREPGEGGLYLWTRSAFGDLHGFVAAWSYWLANVVFLPTVALLISRSALHVFGSDALELADSALYNAVVCLAILWVLTLLNVGGMERAKWIQNVGGAASAGAVLLLVVAAVALVASGDSARLPTASDWLPDLTDLELLGYFAVVAFCFGGLELAPIMAGEIDRPASTVPRAILITSVAVGIINVAGTFALLVALPEGDVGIIEGVAQAFTALDASLGIPGLGVLGALLVTGSTLGLFGSWMTGNARIPFVIGVAHYLPPAFAKVHPRYGSPWVSLLVQAALLTVLLLMSVAGSTIEEAFLVLLDMSIVLYYIPFLYLFAAFARLMLVADDGPRLLAIFGSRPAIATVAGVGFAITLLSTVAASVPTGEVAQPGLFLLKVVGGSAALIALGLVFYARADARSR